MAGITDLDMLIATMRPVLQEETYVFVTLPNAAYGAGAELAPVAAYGEAEGLTLVIPQARAAAHGIAYHGTFRCITLQVHSSLDAVGLTAAVATRLTHHGISANVIAAYHHDHIFVPADRADDALGALERLAAGED